MRVQVFGLKSKTNKYFQKKSLKRGGNETFKGGIKYGTKIIKRREKGRVFHEKAY